MLANFLEFIVSVFQMIISLFQYTDLGGFSFETVLVSIMVISLIVRTIMVKMR